MMISDATVFKKLSDRVWQTPAQVTDELRQCGPLAFVSDQEHRRFFDGSGKEQYIGVYNALRRLRRDNKIDTV
jgi:hypothetical protein